MKSSQNYEHSENAQAKTGERFIPSSCLYLLNQIMDCKTSVPESLNQHKQIIYKSNQQQMNKFKFIKASKDVILKQVGL